MDLAGLPGSVVHSLARMRGIWHEYIEIYDPAGRPLSDDSYSGSPGHAPYERLVYIDFDGERYRQTNVSCAGRPLELRTFGATLRDGVLVFDRLGPHAPEHIGISGGPGTIIFCAREVDPAWQRYSEPDVIVLHGGARRTRTTVLWRDGIVRRSLRAEGTQLSTRADGRVSFDPRGPTGAVHETQGSTQVFAQTQPQDRERAPEGSSTKERR